MYLVPMTVGSGRRSRNVLVERSGRRVRCPGLGASADIVSGMTGEGYDPNLVGALDLLGATDAQLQSLWDNYEAGSPGFTTAANNLLNSLAATAMHSSPNAQASLALPNIQATAAQTPYRPVALQPAVSSWWTESTLGIKNEYLVGGIGGGLLLLLLLRHRR